IPALEALYKAWSSRATRVKYADFSLALQAACQKIDDYYEKTTNSPAYIMTMILDPREKLSYFAKNWSTELQADVLKCVEEVERFCQFNDVEDSAKYKESKSLSKGLSVLLRELSDDEDDEDVSDPALGLSEDPNRPWLRYLNEYINTKELVPTGWTAVEWWG
ncbi:hypothetical protein C0993_003092, partial [Termitomyces sp. T159_Od127]